MIDPEAMIKELTAEAAKLPKASPERIRIARLIQEQKRTLTLRAARNSANPQGNRP